MQFLIMGVALLVLFLLAGRYFAWADPKKLAKNIRSVGGWGLLGIALLLVVSGRGALLALPLALFGLSLLNKSFSWSDPFSQRGKSAGQRSTVRTDMLEMTLEHDSGHMDGVVFRGRFSGRRLSAMAAGELNTLLEEAREGDVQAAQLLEAYIARRQQGSAGGGGGRASGGDASAARGMTMDEAYEILGLPKGAGREDIQQAHRTLMKKYHPDQGGTTYLASKINEAKELLLKHVG